MEAITQRTTKSYGNVVDLDELDLSEVIVGEHTVNVSDNRYRLTDFHNIIPLYDVKNGLHLNNDSTIIPLGINVPYYTYIPKSDNMTDDEYLNEFVQTKKPFASYLVEQTFKLGYEKPSPVQALTLPYMVQCTDMIVQFKSGTGKTHAFIMGTLMGFDMTDKKLQYIYITSSHEVAAQIYNNIKSIMPEETNVALCVGTGMKLPAETSNMDVRSSFKGSKNFLQKTTKTASELRKEALNAQIIVGTVGKIYDYACGSNGRAALDMSNLHAICLDEFDALVTARTQRASTSMTTDLQIAQIFDIIKSGKNADKVQRVFFSATVSEESLNTVKNYLRPYNKVYGLPFVALLYNKDYTLQGIKQYYVTVAEDQDKFDALVEFIKQMRIVQACIFVNKIEKAIYLKNKLAERSPPITTEVFHAHLSAEERKTIHNKMMSGEIRYLISTDVAARGLDIQGVNLVINYDLPNELAVYIHRVGRSGRYGRLGTAISFVVVNHPIDEMRKIEEIRNHSENSVLAELPNDLANLL